MGLTFIDLFSGIGGFRLGLEQAGHICKGHCEIDRFANQSYTAIHQPKEGEWFADDITKVRAADIPRVDIWCFGFPCQDISVAGNQRGVRTGTRSGLFYAVTSLIRELKEEEKPTFLFLENVKNLFSINGGWDFARILIELDEIGYDAEWKLLNSKNFGVPQNRERVFLIANLRGRCSREVFPLRGESEMANKPGRQLANTVTTRTGGAESVGTYIVEGEQLQKSKIRKLTPLECWRLQGFPDWAFERAKAAGVSDSQLYKQAGNSVTVNVIKAIGERLK